MIGEILGNRYELLEQIGEGGMSIVYKARCNKLNRFVAVKILKKEFADNEEIVKKFKIEATAIATLSHSNIVNVLDVGSQNNMNYIVMEYVNGKTLKDVIKEFGPINYETAITVALQIAKALECAHKNNIIHRDVKPQNILVTEDGVVKVTDFGIAKSTASTTLTNTTTIMGSAHYFSPEQAKGTIVDTRTDLYSLGVVIYEMITGKLPFEADSPVTIALKHIQEEVVPPKKINSMVPQSLNDLVLKLMEKEPKDRYQNAIDVINDLQKIKDDPNTIILGMNNSDNIDDGHTIVMNAVNPDDYKNISSNNNSENYDDELEDYDDEDYYDDDYDDDDYDDYEDEVDKKKKGKRNKIIIGSLIGIIAIILVFVGAFALFSNSSNDSKKEMVEIPKISGLTLEQAKVALERKGLVMVDAGEQESDEEEGTVIKVNPKEGTKVEKGSKVRVITSKGNDSTNVIMKDFTESDLETVKTYFDNKNIPYKVIEQYSSSIEAGYVISTDPSAGTEIKKNVTVTIYVSIGEKKEYVEVPNVVGMTSEKAKEKIAELGLLIEIKETEVTDKSQKDIVQSQTNSGMNVEKGATVTVYVGVYKEEEKTLDISSIGLRNGMSVQQASKLAHDAIKNSGLNIHLDYDNQSTGTLIGWNSSNGTDKLKDGDSLTLTFSSDGTDPENSNPDKVNN